jgi:peroxiredoxin
MPTLKNNKIAPSFTLQSTDGKEISLNELIKADNNVLLIFLRHLG